MNKFLFSYKRKIYHAATKEMQDTKDMLKSRFLYEMIKKINWN